MWMLCLWIGQALSGENTMEELAQLIEETALQSIMAEGDDTVGLAKLHTAFEAIKARTDEIQGESSTDLRRVSAASASAVKLIEEIILDEVDDAAAAVTTICDTAKALQQLIAALIIGDDTSAVVFSDQLALLGVADKDADNNADNAPSVDLPDNVDEAIFGEFLSNQPHVLASLESAILTADGDPSSENRAAIKAILHNMKGESGLMGQQQMVSICHEAESLLADDQAAFPGEKLLSSKDLLHNAIAALCGSGGSEGDGDEADEDKPAPEQTEATAEEAAEEEGLKIAEGDIPLVLDFIAESHEHLEAAEGSLLLIEKDPSDSETINAVFRAFHTIKGVAGFLNLKQIGSLAHAAENMLDQARKGDLQLTGPAMDIIFESADVMKQQLENLAEAVEHNTDVKLYGALGELVERLKMFANGQIPARRVGEILIEEKVASAADVRKVLQEQRTSGSHKKLGELLAKKGWVSDAQVEQALQKQQREKSGPVSGPAKKVTTESTVKVTTERLDAMISMVGELVIAQSMVSQDISGYTDQSQRLERNVRHLDKITRELQELSMSMRMVPVQGVFQKMARLVRDLSHKAGKEVELVMTGAETELDRNVVEAIADPLVHMVRNSIDHGLEMPDERAHNGKKPAGRVELKAFHQAGNIVIEIIDDGRGLNRDKILAKAVDNGLVQAEQQISDADIYRMIFHAGLSTAAKVTSVSGRGVGMDVVKKNIEALRGRVDIDSTPGKGTRFSIRLPLTLAVIDGQVVGIGKHTFVIPTLSIEQNLRPKSTQLTTIQGGAGEVINIRGDLLPLVRLHNIFHIEPQQTDPCQALVVVVGDGDGRRCCLQVDNLLGQQQVVIKSLGDFLGAVQGVFGGAIMGDGNVSLILDVPGLINLASLA